MNNQLKLKHLRTYGASESLYRSKKLYRKVFTQEEATYLNVELTLHNLQFTKADWDGTFYLRCLNNLTGKELCKLEKKVTVSKDADTIKIADGWGTKETGWWAPGTYRWQVFAGDQWLGETNFYVLGKGAVTATANPYINFKNVRLYESEKGTLPADQRSYVTEFAADKTRFINIEVNLENLAGDLAHFPLELEFIILHSTGNLKCRLHCFKHITDQPEVIKLDTGYGTSTPGYWKKGKYEIRVLFMDRVIKTLSFVVGDETVEV